MPTIIGMHAAISIAVLLLLTFQRLTLFAKAKALRRRGLPFSYYLNHDVIGRKNCQPSSASTYSKRPSFSPLTQLHRQQCRHRQQYQQSTLSTHVCPARSRTTYWQLAQSRDNGIDAYGFRRTFHSEIYVAIFECRG
mmetsp:Transcript_22813/g.40901  ORF Transcript_22813/g.40901 Transcript_22813/m.40901 type:complete len:137 (-) Transcript_22813:2224-2634(-)